MSHQAPPKRLSATALQNLCHRFNQEFPVGSPVYLRRDFGQPEIETVVTAGAFVLNGHSAVAFFQGIGGCHSIERGRVRARNAQPADVL